MKLTKKLFLTIGGLTSVVAPIATVISCGNDSESKTVSNNSNEVIFTDIRSIDLSKATKDEIKAFVDAIDVIKNTPGSKVIIDVNLPTPLAAEDHYYMAYDDKSIEEGFKDGATDNIQTDESKHIYFTNNKGERILWSHDFAYYTVLGYMKDANWTYQDFLNGQIAAINSNIWTKVFKDNPAIEVGNTLSLSLRGGSIKLDLPISQANVDELKGLQASGSSNQSGLITRLGQLLFAVATVEQKQQGLTLQEVTGTIEYLITGIMPTQTH